MALSAFEVEFYEDESGAQPVRDWLMALTRSQRAAVGSAIERILQRDGVDVCGTEFGKHLGKGLFEFRARLSSEDVKRPPAPGEPSPWKLVVRIFCHAHGDRVVLLLAAYDKGADASPKRQREEIGRARARLAVWRRSLARGAREE